MTRVLSGIYGVYAWALLTLLASLTTAILIFVPGLRRRRQIARFSARLLFRLAGIKLKISGAELDAAHPTVIVSNHASYLDGIILAAVLPPNFSFMVKREMKSMPIAGLLLRLVGTEFVERVDARRVTTDTRRIIRNAEAGQGLAAFPEGTFRLEPGLGLFYSGAFAAAVRARMPVVPVTILGSRAILPAWSHLPVPGKLHVIVHPPIAPAQADAGRKDVSRIRDLARERILSVLEEPALDIKLKSPRATGRSGAD